jgi:uncharacterized protein (DUF433 family)
LDGAIVEWAVLKSVVEATVTTSELIERYIIQDPWRPGLAEARLADYGTHVWALVSYYQQAVNRDIDRVAHDYDIPREAVEAALAYYRKNRRYIDARILLNDSPVA